MKSAKQVVNAAFRLFAFCLTALLLFRIDSTKMQWNEPGEQDKKVLQKDCIFSCKNAIKIEFVLIIKYLKSINFFKNMDSPAKPER